MNIQIQGAGRGNKGAELMLLAILGRLRESIPGARFVVAPGAGPYEWRARQGLYQKLDARRAGRLGWLIELLMHRGYCERYGLVRHEDIDVLLDASGFAYGDAWKPEWVEGGARAIAEAKRAGQKVILLPQAFGPFEKTRVREAARSIFENADLIYARDPESHRYVSGLLTSDEVESKLRQAPDFTNLLPGTVPEEWQGMERGVAVIPNAKMLEHGPEGAAERYVPFLCRCIEEVESGGYRPFVLVHEEGDRALAEEVREGSRAEVEVVCEEDPLRLKGIIGTCDFVISSRFHGLVNALSQGVPALATSWSHKYRHLMEEYGVGEFLTGTSGQDDQASEAIQALTNEKSREEISGRIAERVQDLKHCSLKMWHQIRNMLQKGRLI